MATTPLNIPFGGEDIPLDVPTPDEEARADAAARAVDPGWDDAAPQATDHHSGHVETQAQLDEEVEAARLGDELLIAIRPSPATMPGPGQALASFNRTTIDGQRIVVSAGTVEFINMPERNYDHRITVAINDGLLVERLGGTTRATPHPTIKPHAYIESETVIRRRDGDPIAELLLRQEGRGELRQLAVKFLTAESGSNTRVNLTRGSLRDLQESRRPSTPTDPANPLAVALDAYNSAKARSHAGKSGFGYRRAIEQALAMKGLAHSPSTVKNLLRTLRAEELIPASTRGRPARVPKATSTP